MKKYILILWALAFISFTYSQEFVLVDTWKTNGSSIEQMELGPDGNTLLVGQHDGTLSTWDTKKRIMTGSYKEHN